MNDYNAKMNEKLLKLYEVAGHSHVCLSTDCDIYGSDEGMNDPVVSFSAYRSDTHQIYVGQTLEEALDKAIADDRSKPEEVEEDAT